MSNAEQLTLFGGGPERVRAVSDTRAADLALALPPHLRFGTSSWAYPGWEGLVFEGYVRRETLARSGLRAYAAHPLFRAVGIDRSHYAPIPEEDLRAYAAQVPAGFVGLSKVWDEVTTYVFPSHPKYGSRAGTKNPRFLDAALVHETVLPAYEAAFAAHAGPFIFELPRVPSLISSEVDAIHVALDRLLGALPSHFKYAVELRTAPLLGPRYLDILRAHGVAHVLNFWTGMPDIGAQLGVPGILSAPFVVARLMIPPRVQYEDAKAAYEPFNRIVAPQPAMRRDIVALSRRCEAEGRTLTVLVGNKSEGCAPLTVRALAEAVAEDRGGGL